MKKLVLILLLLFSVILSSFAVDFKMVSIPDKKIAMLNVEVTQALYQEVTGDNPSQFYGSDCPVENISWHDAIRFCNRLSKKNGLKKAYIISEENEVTWDKTANGFRLPTEGEWEYAAKGGENYKYAGSDDLEDVAWYRNNSGGKTHPVAQLDPNGFGLYDMTGNVSEWCWGVNPHNSKSRYIRGGCWYDKASYCELSYRYWGSNGNGEGNIGFRIVRNME